MVQFLVATSLAKQAFFDRAKTLPRYSGRLRLDLSKVGQPTKAMRSFATKIHCEIDDGLSQRQFAQVLDDFDKCSEYISKHKEECFTRWWGCDDNPFRVPCNVLEDLDCSDLGIYPWGDS